MACTHTQHFDETLEPLTWIRVRPSLRHEHTHSRVLACFVTCNMNISKYTNIEPRTRPSFRTSHLATVLTLMVAVLTF